MSSLNKNYEPMKTQIVRFQHVKIKLIYDDYIYYIYINK